MATLRKAAQGVLREAKEAIGWIVFWKTNKGWDAAAFWPDYNEREHTMIFDEYDLPLVLRILERDPDAIIVNGYESNLGDTETMTRDSLGAALRWQYELQHARLADYFQTGTSYLVISDELDLLGKTPIYNQAKTASQKAAKKLLYADLVQLKVENGCARVKRVRYFKDGSTRKILQEQKGA